MRVVKAGCGQCVERSAADLDLEFRFGRYPPRGVGGERAVAWGLGSQDYLSFADEETLIIPLIETRDANDLRYVGQRSWFKKDGMEVIVEIGTPQQQKIYKQELSVFQAAARHLEKVIVPVNYEAKVRELQNRPTFEAIRVNPHSEQTSLGVTLPLLQGTVIVLPSKLFLDPGHDVITRRFVFLHERQHALNLVRFRRPPTHMTAHDRYLSILFDLYDEYTADRIAYSGVDFAYPKGGAAWDDFKGKLYTGYTYGIDNRHAVTIIRRVLKQHIANKNDDDTLKHIVDNSRPIWYSFAHASAFCDHHNVELLPETAARSTFLNDRGMAVMRYLRECHSRNAVDLADGVELLRAYLEDFGFRIMDTPEGLLWGHFADSSQFPRSS